MIDELTRLNFGSKCPHPADKCFSSPSSSRGPFKYYVIKEGGDRGRPNDYVITYNLLLLPLRFDYMHSYPLRHLTQEKWMPTFWRQILNILDFQQPRMIKIKRTVQAIS